MRAKVPGQLHPIFQNAITSLKVRNFVQDKKHWHLRNVANMAQKRFFQTLKKIDRSTPVIVAHVVFQQGLFIESFYNRGKAIEG